MTEAIDDVIKIEPAWQSIGDVDPVLARRVRERLFRELEDPTTLGAGAHFPELRFGRVLAGQGRPSGPDPRLPGPEPHPDSGGE